MRLSILWRIMEIEEGVIRRGRRPRPITPSEISIILHMIRKPNSITVLLFIQNIAKTCFLRRSIDVQFIFDIVRLGLSSSANILQMAESPSEFLLCFWPLFRLVPAVVLTLKTSEVSAILVFTTKLNSTSSPGLLG